MCGIAGQYCLHPSAALSQSILQDQSDLLHHRGPDDEGFWTNTVLGMCHRRLAILDPEGGHQPMQGPKGTVLTYNGEIYNYRELQTELEVRGHRFQTHSDAEVLLAAYEEWGSASWQRLNGMFAFTLWDELQHTLYLVRDRFGIKPLFYSAGEDKVHFASEPSALLQCPGVRRDIEPEVILGFLLFYQPVLGDRTLFRDIRALEPGCELTIDKSGLHKRRWWEPKVSQSNGDTLEDETAIRGKLRHLLGLATQRQMVADVPVGALLSGGLDSTILVGLMAQMAPENPLTYTICLEGDDEEAEFASIAARYFNTKHKSYTVSADEFFRGMEELVRARKLPLVVPNEVLIYLLARRIAPEVKVVLTGEGADELFGGYSNLLSAVDIRTTSSEKTELTQISADSTGTPAFEKEWARFLCHYSWFSKEELHSLLKPQIARILECSVRNSHISRYFQNLRNFAPLSRALMFLEYMHLPSLLGRLDGAMMAASVEGRVPYTDYELVEFVTGLRGSLKYPGGLKPDKYLLRKTFEDLVPTPILNRPKKAFPVPLERLFQLPPGKAALERIMNCEPLFNYFRPEALREWIKDGQGPGFALQAWKLLSLSIFLENNK